MNQSEYLAFRVKHETALSDLRDYARDCPLDADRLNPILQASTFEDMVRAAPNLNQYRGCSIFIDELADALIQAAVTR